MLGFNNDDGTYMRRFKYIVNTIMVIVAVVGVFLTYYTLKNGIKTYKDTVIQNSKRNLIETDIKEKYKMLDDLLVEIKSFTENEFLYQINSSDYEARNMYYIEMNKARMGIVANLDPDNTNYTEFLELTTRIEDREKMYQEAKKEGKPFLPLGTVAFLENTVVESYFKEERAIVNKLVSNKN